MDSMPAEEPRVPEDGDGENPPVTLVGLDDHPASLLPEKEGVEERAAVIRARIGDINKELEQLHEEKVTLTRMLAGVWLSDAPKGRA